jgi:hypothetical protein
MFKNPLVVLAIIIFAAGMAIYFFVDEETVEDASSETLSENIVPPRSDGDDFDGLAVFPTWSTLEPATFPVLIDGEARGPWFFEATFPVQILLADGVVLGEGYAQAQGVWMTEDIVPFYAEIKLAENAPEYVGTAALVLRKANPSGLPENDAQFTTTIVVDTTQ